MNERDDGKVGLPPPAEPRAAADWVAAEYARQYADYLDRLHAWVFDPCPDAVMPKRPTIVLIGHSYGGDAAFHLANQLHDLGLHVDVLLTLDPVGDSSGTLADHDTWWSNVYDVTLLDAAGKFLSYPGQALGFLAGLIPGVLGDLGVPTGVNMSDVIAAGGGRYAHEDGASWNSQADDVHHGNAAGYLEHALRRDGTLQARTEGIIKRVGLP